jgi:DNA helicase II / ATP-dependent DNA helicase PcrA
MDEGSLPHARSVDKPEQLEEERRLAYVGFTRAMHRLYLVRAYRRSIFGESQATEPSRFLEDIPVTLVKSEGSAGSSRQSGGLHATVRRRSNWDDDYNQDSSSSRETGRVFGSGKPQVSRQAPQWTPPRTSSSQKSSSNVTPSLPSSKTPSMPAGPKGQQYKAGDRVRHDKFGDGIVLKSEMEQDTEFVEVQFPGKHGKKTLNMDFAKLEKI